MSVLLVRLNDVCFANCAARFIGAFSKVSHFPLQTHPSLFYLVFVLFFLPLLTALKCQAQCHSAITLLPNVYSWPCMHIFWWNYRAGPHLAHKPFWREKRKVKLRYTWLYFEPKQCVMFLLAVKVALPLTSLQLRHLQRPCWGPAEPEGRRGWHVYSCLGQSLSEWHFITKSRLLVDRYGGERGERKKPD